VPFGTIKLHPAKWDVWAKADVVELREAIALSLNIDPHALFEAWRNTRQSFDFLAPDEKALVWERVKLSTSHLGGKLKAAGEMFQGSKALETKVHLVGFAEFAAWIGWDLAPRFPGRKERDEVGALILNATRLRPEWNFYADIPHPLLWALVAMACDIDPRNIDVLNPAERIAPDLVQFWKRFTIAQAQVEAGKLAVVEMGEKLSGDFNFAVSVSWDVFSRWTTTLSCPWELPKEFTGAKKSDPADASLPVVVVKQPQESQPKSGTAGETEDRPEQAAPLAENARETLLTIIAGAIGDALENQSTAAKAIERRLEKWGIDSPKHRQILNWLNEAKQAMDKRKAED
jgi:hypothetical protein